MTEIEDLKKRFQEKWVPSKYLETYSNSQIFCENFLVPKLHEAIESGNFKGRRGIDIGCGPTVHRMAILSRVCEEILACDFTQANLNLVRTWLKGEEPAGLFTDTLKIASQLEGYEDIREGEKVLSERLRSKLKHVVHCDLINSESVCNLLEYGGQFDCAHSNGCVESASLTYESIVDILKRIAMLLKPGGIFALSGYLGGDFYYVGGIKFECFHWDKDIVQRGLAEAGFKLKTFVESQEGDLDDLCNIQTVFFSLSVKV